MPEVRTVYECPVACDRFTSLHNIRATVGVEIKPGESLIFASAVCSL